MNQENLTKLLDWLLYERLCKPSREYSATLPKRVRRLFVWILEACRYGRGDGGGKPLDDATISRINSLLPSVRDALRRYYVFGETDASIAASMELSLPEFHRMRISARDFVLGRRQSPNSPPSGTRHRVQ